MMNWKGYAGGVWMNRKRLVRGRAFKIYDERELRNVGACVRYMTNRNCRMGRFMTFDQPESLNEAVSSRYMMNWNGQMGGRIC